MQRHHSAGSADTWTCVPTPKLMRWCVSFAVQVSIPRIAASRCSPLGLFVLKRPRCGTIALFATPSRPSRTRWRESFVLAAIPYSGTTVRGVMLTLVSSSGFLQHCFLPYHATALGCVAESAVDVDCASNLHAGVRAPLGLSHDIDCSRTRRASAPPTPTPIFPSPTAAEIAPHSPPRAPAALGKPPAVRSRYGAPPVRYRVVRA